MSVSLPTPLKLYERGSSLVFVQKEYYDDIRAERSYKPARILPSSASHPLVEYQKTKAIRQATSTTKPQGNKYLLPANVEEVPSSSHLAYLLSLHQKHKH